jgi:hypothetical protein
VGDAVPQAYTSQEDKCQQVMTTARAAGLVVRGMMQCSKWLRCIRDCMGLTCECVAVLLLLLALQGLRV